MFDLLRLWSGLLIRLVRSRLTLLIENLALRQQLAVFKRQNSRPRLATADKIFGVLLLRSGSLLEDGTHRRVARDRCALASCGLPTLLATHLARA
jgi:hypothetical protein